MNATGWSHGLEVTGGGTGVVSHAGLTPAAAAIGPHGPDGRAAPPRGEIAAGGDRRRRKITAAVNKARRHAWAHGIIRHGGLPPVRVADRKLQGVTCIRLDATVVTAHSDKELAEPDSKGLRPSSGHRGLR